MFRGALGTLLRQDEYTYSRIFKPTSDTGPSGLADSPRPFLIRTRHLDGLALESGQLFHVDLHLFTLAHQIADRFSEAFACFASVGLGSKRSRVSLESVTGPDTVALPPHELQQGVTQVDVTFASPTELKHNGEVLEEPLFPVLWARASSRIGALCTLYGDGPLDIDFRHQLQRANEVRLRHHALRHVNKHRRSSRTGQVHPLGGFIGRVSYEGPLDSFLPYLEAASWTGIGRQTAWGKGEIIIRASASSSALTISAAPR